VFLAPPWPEIYRTDSERKQDLEEAIRTYETMAEVYRDAGYSLCILPKVAPDARARFILDRLGLSS
jgi:predicted ATPase